MNKRFLRKLINEQGLLDDAMLLTVRTMEILVLVLTESQGRHNSSCFICEPPSFSLQAPERMFPNGLIFHVTEREVLYPSLMLAFLSAI